jgi:EAL domain-containing protein (putative c-di-GMP-specific phosphodiesterase class I)
MDVSLRASMGIATPGLSAAKADDLLRDADIAMYVAKGEGKDRYRLFEGGMHGAVLHRLEMEAALERAIEQDELELFYQPVVTLADRRAVGVEALVRWMHPERGLVGPADFIPLAEATGLVVPLGRWVLEHACRQMATWAEASPSPLWVSVNISATQLRNPRFVDDVRAALEGAGLAAGQLVLEITESVIVQGVDEAAGRLLDLRRLGVRVALDDFGVGYSSLSYLQALPIDLLKIDRSFVESVVPVGGRASLVPTIIRLAQVLGLQTVAEGIERPEQVDELRALGCDLGQGYLFAHPAPAADVEPFLLTLAEVQSRPGGGRFPA